MYKSVQPEVLNKGICYSEAIRKTSFPSTSELSSEGWKETGKLKRREGTFSVERTAPVLRQEPG